MPWMNEHEVREAVRLMSSSRVPNLQRGAEVLSRLVDWVNNNSDGWPYWKQPSRASQNLMSLLERARKQVYAGTLRDISEADLAKALRPIKAFLTRQDVKHDTVI